MNRLAFVLAGTAFILAAMTTLGHSAKAQPLAFEIYNNTRIPVVEFETVNPRTGEWGRSWRLPGGELEPGTFVRMRFANWASNDCLRHYKVVFADGHRLIGEHNFCRFHGIHIHYRQLVGTRF